MSAGFRFSRDGVLDYKEFNSLLRVVFPDSSLSTVPEEKLRAFMTSLDCNKVEYKITDQIKRQRHSNGSATQKAAPLKRQRHSNGSATQTTAYSNCNSIEALNFWYLKLRKDEFQHVVP